MKIRELPDFDEARTFLTQGFWLQRMMTPLADRVQPVLNLALAVASSEQTLPPVGFLADLEQCLLNAPSVLQLNQIEVATLDFPSGLLRSYEDHVLGKILSDHTLERAGDALQRYRERDRARGLAFVVRQMYRRCEFLMVSVNPAAIKTLLKERPGQLLQRGWDSLQRDGALPALVQSYESLVAAARGAAEMLGPEDVFELEHGTAVADFSQRVALRQVLQAVDWYQKSLPEHRPSPTYSRREVPTRVLADDTYPVGGFASLSTRGSIESLLQSQLAFMEPHQRPDLFDIKYLRDELLYYSRDENQFLRRRRTFVFALFPELVDARWKDSELNWQQIILLLALIVILIGKLCDWLSDEALLFEVIFISEGKEASLAPENELLQMLLREQVANGTVTISAIPPRGVLAAKCRDHSRRSLCQCLLVGMRRRQMAAEDTRVHSLDLSGPAPDLIVEGEMEETKAAAPMDAWLLCLKQLLGQWI